MIYAGSFMWSGATHLGSHQRIVTRELWERVQKTMRSRHSLNHPETKRQFAFAGLIQCGYCGCAMTGEIKKEKYVYYRCTRNRGKREQPDRNIKEEMVISKFREIVASIHLDSHVVDLVSRALKESHHDEKEYHQQAIARLQSRYNHLQKLIDGNYVKMLEGEIDSEFFKRMDIDFRDQQREAIAAIHQHQTANENNIEEGIKLLELSQRPFDSV